MIPPPTAVITAKTVIPKISMRFVIPTTAPEKAKAIIPIMSNISNVIMFYVLFLMDNAYYLKSIKYIDFKKVLNDIVLFFKNLFINISIIF